MRIVWVIEQSYPECVELINLSSELNSGLDFMVAHKVFPVVSQGTAAKKNPTEPKSIFPMDNTNINAFKTDPGNCDLKHDW